MVAGPAPRGAQRAEPHRPSAVPATDDSTTACGSPTAANPSTARTSPDTPSLSPTPVSFAAAEFTFGELPKESAFSFISTDGRGRPLRGTVRIGDACLPVVGG